MKVLISCHAKDRLVERFKFNPEDTNKMKQFILQVMQNGELNKSGKNYGQVTLVDVSGECFIFKEDSFERVDYVLVTIELGCSFLNYKSSRIVGSPFRNQEIELFMMEELQQVKQ